MNTELHAGNAHGFIGPLKPPSVQWCHGQDARWFNDHLAGSNYAWGRHDAGEWHDANDIYNFGLAWADMQWAFRHQYREFLPSLCSAYEEFFGMADDLELIAHRKESAREAMRRRRNRKHGEAL